MNEANDKSSTGKPSGQVKTVEQEDGEVSDTSNHDVVVEGVVTGADAAKLAQKDSAASVKTDVNISKKTALEKLKNMNFSSKFKIPIRSSSIERRERERRERQTTTFPLSQQYSPHREDDEERRYRKRRWEERNDEERYQPYMEEQPKPLEETVTDTLSSTQLAALNKSVDPVRPTDQPNTLRQRIEQVISIQESEVINMSDKELRALILRICDLTKEQQRLLRGRQIQYNTLRELYMEVRDDIERLCSRIPPHLRMDIPVPSHMRMDIPVPSQPRMDIPVYSQPRMDIPVPSQPRMDIPVHSQPRMDIPVPSQPRIDIPAHSQPRMNIPVHSQPGMDIPVSSQPRMDIPVPSQPRMDVSVPSQPRMDAPIPSQPRVDAPVLSQPRMDVPVPSQPRMDVPVPSQPLHPSAPSTSGRPQINGGTTTYHLEQQLRLPSLFDTPPVGSNTRLNAGNNSALKMQMEGGPGERHRGFNEMENASSDSKRMPADSNVTFYGSGPHELGMRENMGHLGTRSSGPVLRNEDGPDAVGCALHASSNRNEAVCHIGGKLTFYSALKGSEGDLEYSSSMIPSTSIQQGGDISKLLPRKTFSESPRFPGPSHEVFPKVATDMSLRVDSFNQRSPPMMNFSNTVNLNQASHMIGRQIFDVHDKSSVSAYGVVSKSDSVKLDLEESDRCMRGVGEHNYMRSRLSSSNSFSLNNPISPKPPNPDFPTTVLGTVISSAESDSTRHNAYLDDRGHPHRGTFRASDVLSNSQASLPNLSEPPPSFSSTSTNPILLPNKLSVSLPINTLQNSNMVPQHVVPPTSGGVPTSTFTTEHAAISIRPLLPSGTSTLPVNCNTTQSLQTQPGNTAAIAAPPLLPLHSGPNAINVPPPDFSIPPPVTPSLAARTGCGASSINTNLRNRTESTGSGSRATPVSNSSVQGSFPDLKGGGLPKSTVLSGLPSMNIPPPSFGVPPPRGATVHPFSTPPPSAMPPARSVPGPRPGNLTPSISTQPPSLMSGHIGLNCPPPDLSQPPPNIRNTMSGNSPEIVQQMVSTMVNQSVLGGQTSVEIVTDMMSNSYNRAGNVRLPYDAPLKQRLSMAMENSMMLSRMRTPTPVGPPKPLSSVGKLPPPLMLSPQIHGGANSRNPSFNKQKVPLNRSSTSRPQIRPRRHISDMVAIIPDEHDHLHSRGEPDDNIFLIVSDEEDRNT